MGVGRFFAACLASLFAATVLQNCSVDYEALAGGNGSDSDASVGGGIAGMAGTGPDGDTGGSDTGATGGTAGTGADAGQAGTPGGGTGASGGSGGTGAVGGTGGTGGTTGGTGGTGASGGSGGTGGGGEGGSAGTGGTTGPEGPSCGAGLDCAAVSCCLNLLVPGGTLEMGRGDSGSDAYGSGNVGADEQPEHNVTVNDFYLDAFEVTVGRFRAFVADYEQSMPPWSGVGAHPDFPGSGWDSAWDNNLQMVAVLEGQLICDGIHATWTSTPGSNETLPINCATWFEAFAFCIWDGARLLTEAEWEYAAAGGGDDRLYPWGPDNPDVTRAVYNNAPLVAVGSTPAGNGRWDHRDLAGSLSEWTLDRYEADWYGRPEATGPSYVNLTSGERVHRGGSFQDTLRESLRAADRASRQPLSRSYLIGFRCARDTT